MKIGYLHLKQPINGKKKILDENTFVSLYLGSDKTMEQIAREQLIPYSMVANSASYWRHKYDKEIRERKHKNYAKVAFLREPPKQEHQQVRIEKDVLISLIAEGKSEEGIARELGIAPQTLRKNIRRCGLAIPTRRIRMSERDYSNLQWLELLVPGIVESSYSAVENPSKFFHLLYDGFVKVLGILDTIRILSRKYKYYQYKGDIVRDHISWRANRHEILVSERLRELGVFHIRDYFWAKKYDSAMAADIYIPDQNLVVEIDGSIHGLDIVKVRDSRKYEMLKKEGINYLRFTTKEVDKDLEEVINKILGE